MVRLWYQIIFSQEVTKWTSSKMVDSLRLLLLLGLILLIFYIFVMDALIPNYFRAFYLIFLLFRKGLDPSLRSHTFAGSQTLPLSVFELSIVLKYIYYYFSFFITDVGVFPFELFLGFRTCSPSHFSFTF